MLVESMIAISVLMTGLMGAVALLNRSFSLNRTIASNYTATYLAAEGLELTKNFIDTNVIKGKAWNDGFSNGPFETDYRHDSLLPSSNRSLGFDPATNFYSYGAPETTVFNRLIRIDLVSSDEMRVNSIVSWSSGLYQSTVNLEDTFYNWRP